MLRRLLLPLVWLVMAMVATTAWAQVPQQVVDLPTRPNVQLRLLLLTPPAPKAAVILLNGGNGNLQIGDDGSVGQGGGNFLVRSRQRFAAAGLLTAVVAPPSDRQTYPFLSGFRQTPEHAEDLRRVIAWLRSQQPKLPVWLVGTSRGTQSAAYVATQLTGSDGPDGLVLTSTLLKDKASRAVPQLPLDSLRMPVLVVHHRQDDCAYCAFADLPLLMERLAATPRHELIALDGGISRGDPCEAWAYHGYNGIEDEAVGRIAAWITAGQGR